MLKNKISGGVVHKLPEDMYRTLNLSKKLLGLWEDITPLARNEWICWVESAKKDDTRNRRIRIMSDKLLKGDRRPCCWAGCIHR